MAAAMLPGTFTARRHVAGAPAGLLSGLTALQAGLVVALGLVRPQVGVTLALLAVMAFTNGWRSMVASALGMDTAPEDRVAVMAMRAAANQSGYLLRAAAGGVAPRRRRLLPARRGPRGAIRRVGPRPPSRAGQAFGEELARRFADAALRRRPSPRRPHARQ